MTPALKAQLVFPASHRLQREFLEGVKTYTHGWATVGQLSLAQLLGYHWARRYKRFTH